MMKKSPVKQHGLSLIELMIAMALGLFVIVGISYVYINGKKSSITNDQVSMLQANGQAALQELTSIIQHAGYSSSSVAPFKDIFIRDVVSTSSCTDSTDSVSTPALFSAMTNNTTTYGDTIGVVYLGDDTLNLDCAGNELPTTCQLGSGASRDASKIYNQFFVAQNAAGDPALNCSGSRTAGSVEIAEGVENIQFVYGEDINADGVADRYVNSTSVTNWEEVVSVNISVLIRSLQPVARTNTARSYQLSEDSVINTNDRYLRSVFTATVRLRNVIL
jgi:type IV pilus assembly protein PilW